MATLLSPEVRGPISECSKLITVAGQVFGATVTVLQDGIPVGSIESPGAVIKVPITEELVGRKQITATQEIAGDISEPSPVAVVVQPFAELGPVELASPLRACSALTVDGVFPGAVVVILDAGGTEIGSASENQGRAVIAISPPIIEGERISIFQKGCDEVGPATESSEALPAREIIIPALDSETLQACSPFVAARDLTEGSLVTIKPSSGPTGSLFIPANTNSAWIALPKPLEAGETVELTVSLPECDFPDISTSGVAGDGIAPATPTVWTFCEDSRLVHVSGLYPGAQVELADADGTLIGRGSADRQVMTFGLPDATELDSTVSARQKLCEWSSYSIAAEVQTERFPSVYLKNARLDRFPKTLDPCATYVDVQKVINNRLAGSFEIWSERFGQISARYAGWQVFAGHSTTGYVPIAPALQPADKVWVRNFPCPEDSGTDSEPFVVERLMELEIPQHRYPVRVDSKAIELMRIPRGCRVDVEINSIIYSFKAIQQRYTSGSLRIVAIDLPRSLQGLTFIRVRVALCGTETEWRTIELQGSLPGRPRSLRRSGDDLNPSFSWSNGNPSAESFEFRLYASTEVYDARNLTTTSVDLPSTIELEPDTSYEWDVFPVKTFEDLSAYSPIQGLLGPHASATFRTEAEEEPPPPTRPVTFHFRFNDTNAAVTQIYYRDSFWLIESPSGIREKVDFGDNHLDQYYTTWNPPSSLLSERGNWYVAAHVEYYWNDPFNDSRDGRGSREITRTDPFANSSISGDITFASGFSGLADTLTVSDITVLRA